MAEVGFYHLTRTALEAALPRLLGRVLEGGHRAVVRVGGPERLAALDAALWLAPEPDWLPHGTPADGDPDLQPVWLTTEDGPAPNGATHLLLCDGAEASDLSAWARVLDLFDGTDPAALEAARGRWRRARETGLAPAYWQQGERGWERRGG